MEFTNENYAAFAATEMYCGGKQFVKADCVLHIER